MKGTEMKQENIPKNFKLFGQQWQIRAGTELELEGDLGRCITDENLILLNEHQTEQSSKHTLLHEIVHSIEQKLHLNLTEQQVDLVALGLLDIFANNTEMKQIFTGDDYAKKHKR